MDDMRNQILSDLIDKMHGRMADKLYPDAKPEIMSMDAKPDSAPEGQMEAVEPMAPEDDDLSDSDIDEILKSC